MTAISFLFIFFLILEVFESKWQQSDSFYGVIKNNYQIYNKNIFIYFLFNPTFFFSIYLSMHFNNFGFLMSSIIVMKFLDISLRLLLMNKIQNNEDISAFIPIDIKYTFTLRYFNVFLYPMVFVLSLISY